MCNTVTKERFRVKCESFAYKIPQQSKTNNLSPGYQYYVSGKPLAAFL